MEKQKVGDLFTKLKLEWQGFYKKYLNMDVDFSRLSIPKRPGPGWRLLIIAHGVLPEQIFQAMKNFFKVRKGCDKSLNDLVVFNERDSQNGAYAFWVRDFSEYDKQIWAKGFRVQTLTECLIHELRYFQKTGKHLNGGSGIFCSGSRDDDGTVPHVEWVRYYGELYIFGCHPDYHFQDSFPSRAVSC